MIRGLYSSASGLLVQSARSDVIAANLANLSVPGYRRDVPSVSAFQAVLQHTAAAPAAGPAALPLALLPTTSVDLQPGALRHTGGKFDLALDGPGYFCVLTPTGEAYTRGGAFRLDSSHRLLTAAGDPVLGAAGPIRLTGTAVEVMENGDIVVDAVRVDRLKLADIPSGTRVHKLGRGLLRPDAPLSAAAAQAGLGRVRQGYLEEANANPVAELTSMISALRSFEASQRALQAADRTLDKAVNEIGRV
jgi:flagellar basal-body rod protein FlgF